MTAPQWKRITSPPPRFRTQRVHPTTPVAPWAPPSPPQPQPLPPPPQPPPPPPLERTQVVPAPIPFPVPPAVPSVVCNTTSWPGPHRARNAAPAASVQHTTLRNAGNRAKPTASAVEQQVLQRIEAKVMHRLFTSNEAGHIGRFALLDEIGCGGMGTVYAAYDEQLDRKVAIKILRDDELPDDTDRLRFRREAQALARLSHPNVVTVHEVGESNGELFLAMEFIRGQSIADWLLTKPSWRAVLHAFIQAGRGLVAAHEAGLVHRDLKPHNLMRSHTGVVKVLDFGLARVASDDSAASFEVLTRPGVVVGTPAYMSPEQIQGRAVDASSDQ
ncbi:MAG: serine/threonine-protein kinase, partial [Nannocystaceae bacterium]